MLWSSALNALIQSLIFLYSAAFQQTHCLIKIFNSFLIAQPQDMMRKYNSYHDSVCAYALKLPWPPVPLCLTPAAPTREMRLTMLMSKLTFWSAAASGLGSMEGMVSSHADTYIMGADTNVLITMPEVICQESNRNSNGVNHISS